MSEGVRMGEGAEAGGEELDVRLLGPLEVSRAGASVPIAGAKPRALLATLALEAGRAVFADRLVENLWPGDPPDTVAHAVRVYLSQLRKTLGTASIARRPSGYALVIDADRVDVHRFARLAADGSAALHAGDYEDAGLTLREALSLWRGPALADFSYEPWAQTEIARLEEGRLLALQDRIAADLALGRHVELVPELDALVEAHPLRERPRAQLMLALYLSGRQADALEGYRRARELLVGEQGIEPGPELRELQAAILRQDEALLPEPVATVPAMEFRRTAAILFAAVESLPLSEALDAEAAAHVLGQWSRLVSAAVTKHGGTAQQAAGHAVLAAFGVPVTHEDDVLRAARAAIDIREDVADLNRRLLDEHGVGLGAKIGVEAGEVVAAQGDLRRPVTGEPVGVATALAEAAEPDEIFIGERASRSIAHAAVFDDLRELPGRGKREGVRARRLLEVARIAPAFERRLDGPFVGRKHELAVLEHALRSALDADAVRAVIVAGAAGVGKSRLVAEFASRTGQVTALWGRCLSYGDGITLWPVRQILDRADVTGERDALLAALEAEPPPPAPELTLEFRRFCELLAQRRPLVLIFDDLHWAEPALLELVEHVATEGEGPMLVVCLAREDLLESRPSFLAAAERIVLGGLSSSETDALLAGLGGSVLDPSRRRRIVEAADGNPLFLEQLLAAALEGGEPMLPPTVQALLAARLDRLGPGERAVLERGAVVGKEFAAADVAYLLDDDVAHTVNAHLDALAARGFVRPLDEGSFSFRHVLVQDAVYRAAPKRLRARLHERFAERLKRERVQLPELDELVGYHLEQAHRLRIAVGVADDRAAELAEEAGRRLGSAGTRALRRGDVHAAANLLERATALLRTDDPGRRELLCELALVRVAAHDSEAALEVLTEAIAASRDAGDVRIEGRARIELQYIRLRGEPKRKADDLLEATAEGIPIFERAGDRRALGRAWLLAGFVHGGHRGDHKAWEEAAERALEHYRAVGWPTSTCVGEIAAALYWGPTPVADAIRRCHRLLRDEALDLPGSGYLNAFLGGLAAQQTDFDRARALVESARATLEDLGLRAAIETYCTPLLAEIELLSGDPSASARVLRELCQQLERANDLSHLASRASDLAEALLAEGALDEAEEWTDVAERHAAPDDLKAQLMWRPVRARIHAKRGRLEVAEALAREGVALAEETDDLNRRAKARRDLGEVLELAGDRRGASEAFGQAIELYRAKGNLAGTALVHSVQEKVGLPKEHETRASAGPVPPT